MSTLSHRHPVIDADRLVPHSLRGQVIVLRFAKPVPRFAVKWFYQIRLTRELLKRAEQRFHQVERFQGDRIVKACPSCGKQLARLSPTESRCLDVDCLIHTSAGDLVETRSKVIYSGPVRGVVKVIVSPDQVVGRDERGELVRGCTLALDRRYDDAVRVALWYAAGLITDMMRDEIGQDIRLT